MTNNLYIKLQNRAIISISGNDAKTFLQGLISNDIDKVDEHNAIYALMLTPQGKFLYDFFISEYQSQLFIDCSAEHLNAIVKKLSMYKLRSDVVITDQSEKYESVALIGDKSVSPLDKLEQGNSKSFCSGTAYKDPRHGSIYARAIVAKANNCESLEEFGLTQGEAFDYEAVRIKNAIPLADVDMLSGGAFPLDFCMNKLNAIDYKKGCYVGQEVTARVNHRGKIRKKFYSFMAEDTRMQLERGADIKIGGKKIGTTSSSINYYAAAMLKIDDVECEGKVTVGGIPATVCQKH